MDDKIILTMRAIAWQRAKGELLSILETYWRDDGFKTADEMINKFIKDFEDNCR